jgi:tetratricopeptide (TPR) repeat protein
LKPRNHRSESNRPAEKRSISPLSSPSASAFSGGSKRRLWLLRLSALIVVPLLVFGSAELALRLGGYGYPTSFFLRTRINGHGFYVPNEKFGYRFFSPALARAPVPIRMEAQKAANSYRIFLFGESAANGDPDPAYGVGRYLEVLLRERFPGTGFEVVCVAVTAIDSNANLPIARECAGEQGDLWLIYMGNNEMVGPFGAATVFGAKAPPWWLIRLSLAVQQTRVGQLIIFLTRKLGNNPTGASWGGMQMFLGNQLAPDDPRRETVYRNFQRNLQDILRVGLDSGVKIILSTVAVNLKDCPPFASANNTHLSASSQARFKAQLTEARQQQAASNFTAAAELYAGAAKLDGTFAEVQFHWGECLLAENDFSAAREHFQAACDEDALPFRADSRINGLIRQAGTTISSPDLNLFDAVSAMETNGPARIPGLETFYEHVHFNFDGSYRLARAWAEQVQRVLPEPVKSHATGGWVSQATCEQQLGLTDWNHRLVIQSVVERLRQPPFSTQSNNARRVEAFDNQLKELQRQMDAANARAEAREIYLDASNQSPGDYMLHENFAEFLESIGDFKQAVSEWQQVCQLSPRNPFAFCQAGRLLARMGQWPAAQGALSEAISLHPRYAEARLELGRSYFAEGKYEPALKNYDIARQLESQNPEVYFEMGRTCSLLQRPAESLGYFRRAIQLKPAYWEAHYCLGGELALQGEVAEAKSEFEIVIQLQPDYAPAHLNLGVALMKQNQLPEAIRQFQQTLRLDPTNRFAADYLNQIQPSEKRTPGK